MSLKLELNPSANVGKLKIFLSTRDNKLVIKPLSEDSGEKSFIYKGETWYYKEVTNPVTGRVWMDRNLGASRPAIDLNDSEAFGDLFQWGRLDDGHQDRDSSTTSTTSSLDVPGNNLFITISIEPYDWRIPENSNLWQDGLNDILSGWQVPDVSEWRAEIDTWTSETKSGAFDNSRKFTVGGTRINTGDIVLTQAGTFARYWTRNPASTAADCVIIGNLTETDNVSILPADRANGNIVRLIKMIDVSPGPDPSTFDTSPLKGIVGSTTTRQNMEPLGNAYKILVPFVYDAST